MRAACVALAFATVLASPALTSLAHAAPERGWSRSYGVGACVNCPGGTGVQAGEHVGQGMMTSASGLFGVFLAPFREPVEAGPPPEVFSQKPPKGFNCWVDAGPQRGYWARCP